jgi:acetoin utilization deacetylase AcuC-like enzyme
MAHLRSQEWFEQLHMLAPRIADEATIESVHSRQLIERARSACEQELPFLDVMDTGVSRDSFDVALLAAGGAQELADRVIAADVENAFALCRPPGHHAEHDLALGFCLFNNVAVAARYLQKQHGLEKILILDWDVHHGNGTQHSFEDDPSVLYVSTHQYPYYPGTGAYSETGVDRGEGATLNCPMPAGAGDEQYRQVFGEKILPKIDAFAPQFVILSAGFDAHVDDPLANISLSTEFFGWMSARMMEVADKHCDGRLISLLEGGYNINKLPLCVDEHLQILAGCKES